MPGQKRFEAQGVLRRGSRIGELALGCVGALGPLPDHLVLGVVALVLDQELGLVRRPALPEGDPAPIADDARVPRSNGDGGPAGPHLEANPEADGRYQIKQLLGAGQALLDQDKPEGALTRFEEALAIDPRHGEALVKKGAALERLQKPDEAIVCYDQAIAADGSLTVAYLHKGGLFNRMEKFAEALECYELALRTQEKRTG